MKKCMCYKALSWSRALCFPTLQTVILCRRRQAANMFLYFVWVSSLSMDPTAWGTAIPPPPPLLCISIMFFKAAPHIHECICKWLHLVTISDLTGSHLTQNKGPSWYGSCWSSASASKHRPVRELTAVALLPQDLSHSALPWHLTHNMTCCNGVPTSFCLVTKFQSIRTLVTFLWVDDSGARTYPPPTPEFCLCNTTVFL